jgi:hypothetical protein
VEGVREEKQRRCRESEKKNSGGAGSQRRKTAEVQRRNITKSLVQADERKSACEKKENQTYFIGASIVHRCPY